jgi:hypothetical protein
VAHRRVEARQDLGLRQRLDQELADVLQAGVLDEDAAEVEEQDRWQR